MTPGLTTAFLRISSVPVARNRRFDALFRDSGTYGIRQRSAGIDLSRSALLFAATCTSGYVGSAAMH